MKKISKLAGIVAAAALLCGISACDNSETITMTSASIEMVGDPIVTNKAAIFQWKNSVANSIVVTRQAPNEEEVTISNGWTGWTDSYGFVDRVMNDNLLKAGVEYTYRFYNTKDISSARTTEYTLEKKYSCVERKVTFPSIDPKGTKLAPITKEQITISTSELNGKNYVSVYVDEKESRPWIDINDKTTGVRKNELYDIKIGGVEAFEYNPSHRYEIKVGKWYPEDIDEDERYYDPSDSTIKFENFDLGSLKNIKDNIVLDINPWNDSFKVNWNGEKDCTYEVSFEAFDNQGKAVALKKSTIATADIKKDAFDNYEVTGKVSDLIDITKPTTVKTAKAILKETAKDGTISESEDEEIIYASSTTYTQVYDGLSVHPSYNIDEYYNQTFNGLLVTLSGTNLPATAKLYYKQSGDKLYTEVTDGLKKAEGSNNLTATVSLKENNSYDFKAVVTVDNKNWYYWEEGKTEETSIGYYSPSSQDR